MTNHFADRIREVCLAGPHIYDGVRLWNEQYDVAEGAARERGSHRIAAGHGSCLAQPDLWADQRPRRADRCNGSVGRTQVKHKQLVSLALVALACWFSSPAAAANDPQVLQVTQLKAQSSELERQEARRAFQNRQAVVVMTEGTVQDFGRLLGAQMTDTKAFSKTGRSPISARSALKPVFSDRSASNGIK